jgi:hypothetical protein
MELERSVSVIRFPFSIPLSSFSFLLELMLPYSRIGKLEMLDEVEELDLVLEHYAVTWGVKLPSDGSTTAAWDRWGMEPTGDTQEVDSDE